MFLAWLMRAQSALRGRSSDEPDPEHKTDTRETREAGARTRNGIYIKESQRHSVSEPTPGGLERLQKGRVRTPHARRPDRGRRQDRRHRERSPRPQPTLPIEKWSCGNWNNSDARLM